MGLDASLCHLGPETSNVVGVTAATPSRSLIVVKRVIVCEAPYLTDIMDTLAQGCCGCFCTSTPPSSGRGTVLNSLFFTFRSVKAERHATYPRIPVGTKAHRARSRTPLIRFGTQFIARSRCCGSKVPGGPLESDEFEREAHKEIAELKAKSRIRQLEAEQRQLQKNQPARTEDMTTKPE